MKFSYPNDACPFDPAYLYDEPPLPGNAIAAAIASILNVEGTQEQNSHPDPIPNLEGTQEQNRASEKEHWSRSVMRPLGFGNWAGGT